MRGDSESAWLAGEDAATTQDRRDEAWHTGPTATPTTPAATTPASTAGHEPPF